MKKTIPPFATESDERAFWAQADSTDYIDWNTANRVTLPNLRPSTRTISLRLPEFMLAQLKTLANRRDVPYQSLMKVFLAERIDEELRSAAARPPE
jgi:predicted DNA binding CopG/RHH family protein